MRALQVQHGERLHVIPPALILVPHGSKIDAALLYVQRLRSAWAKIRSAFNGQPTTEQPL